MSREPEEHPLAPGVRVVGGEVAVRRADGRVIPLRQATGRAGDYTVLGFIMESPPPGCAHVRVAPHRDLCGVALSPTLSIGLGRLESLMKGRM